MQEKEALDIYHDGRIPWQSSPGLVDYNASPVTAVPVVHS